MRRAGGLRRVREPDPLAAAEYFGLHRPQQQRRARVRRADPLTPMKTRLPLRWAVLLACLGLGAFASPAAAQVFDGFPFKGAVFTRGLLEMNGGVTDSYNSDLGPYNPATVGNNGDIASNNNILLSSGSTVKGDATAVGTNTGGTVTGTRTQGATPVPTPVSPPCPTGGYTPAAYIPSGPGVTYNATTGVLKVQGGTNLTLTAPPIKYYFSEVVISGGSTLTVNGGGQQVQIWIDNKLTLSGGGVLNTDAKAPLPGTNYTVSFTVQNLGNANDSYDLLTSKLPGTALTIVSITGSGVTQGANPDSARRATLAPGATVTVTVTGFSIAVTPDTTAASRLPSNATNYTVTFTVRNTGSGADNFDLLTSRLADTALTTVSIAGNGVTQGSNPDSARLANLVAGDSVTVTVTYAVRNVPLGTTDTLVLTARSVAGPTNSDNGRLTLTVVRPSLTVAKGVNPGGTQPPGTDLSYTMAVTNAGTTHAAGVALVDTLAPAVQFKVGSVATTLPAGVTAAVQYSNDGGATWTYAPASEACGAPAGYDRCANRIRWQLQNPLSFTAPDNTAALLFVAQIR